MADAPHVSPAPVGERVREVSDGIAKLVREHVELARSEVQTSMKRAAFDASLTLTGALLLALGWVLLMFAVGYGLGSAVGLARSFLLVAGAHVVAGFALVSVFASRLKEKDKPKLDGTAHELKRDKYFVNRVGHIMRDQPPH